MNNRIIFLEGLPGSGKTVFSKRLKKDLKTCQETIQQFEEGELNPIDLGYQSVMTMDEYNTVLKQFPNLSKDIERVSKQFGEWMVVAFTKISRPRLDDSFYDTFSRYQLMEFADYETFKNIYFSLWRTFVETNEKGTLYLYGGAFLQNQYEPLLLKYGLSAEEMKRHFQILSEIIKPLNPIVVYIAQKDIKRTIKNVAEKRKTDNKEVFKDWFDMVLDSLKAMPLSKQMEYEGTEGAYRFYRDEQDFELDLLSRMDIETIILELNQDYDAIYDCLLGQLKKN